MNLDERIRIDIGIEYPKINGTQKYVCFLSIPKYEKSFLGPVRDTEQEAMDDAQKMMIEISMLEISSPQNSKQLMN